MQREIKTTLALDGEKAFKQELEAASRQLRVLGSEMKANTAAFANNADSLDALTSRGKIFEKQVAQQKEIVAALSRAVQDSASKYGEADKRTDGYRIKLNNATATLAKMENELEQNSQAIKEMGQDATGAASKIDKLKESAQKMGESLQATGDKISGIGQTMSMSITAPVLGVVALATEGTKEFRTELAMLEQNAKTAGVNFETMNTALRDANAITGELDSSGEGLANLLAAGFKDNNMQAAMEAVSGAAIKFKDTLKFEGIADGLQETLATGAAVGPFAELLDRSGIALDGFNEGLRAAIENGTQQQYVLDVLAKAGLPAVYEEYTKTNQALLDSSKAQYDLQASLSGLGKTIEPILTMVTTKITELLTWFNGLDESTQKNILTVAGLVAAAGPLVIVLGSVIGAVGTITGALPVLGTAFTVLTGPIGLAIAAVAALVAGGVALYKNWDEVKAYAGQLKTKLIESFNDIKASVQTVISDAKNWGSNIVEGLWNGISDRATWLYDKVTGWAKNIITAAKKALDVRSPSKAMYDIGIMAAAGLAMGLGDGKEGVKTKTELLADEILKIKDRIQDLNRQYEIAAIVEGVNSEVAAKLTEEIAKQVIAYDKLSRAVGKVVEQKKTLGIWDFGGMAGMSRATSISAIAEDALAKAIEAGQGWSVSGGQVSAGGTVVNFDTKANITINDATDPEKVGRIVERQIKTTFQDLAHRGAFA